jgi:signal transduction histidine kinase/DNA-binding NarL/FixJ family response regulator
MISRASIRTQLRLLGLFAAIGAIVVVGTERALLRGAQARFDQEETQNSVRRAREALSRAVYAERRRITETAWWDETYAYMAQPDGPAASKFLKENFVDWLPSQYGDEFIGIWRADHLPRFRWNAPAAAGLDTLLPVAALLARLDDRRAGAGLLDIGGQLWFVTGALILPSSDGNNGAPARGYVITARRAGQDITRDLALTLQEEVALRPAAPFSRDKVTRVATADGDTTRTTFLVPNFFERRAVEMELRASRAFLAGLETWSRRFLVIVGVMSFGLLLLVTYLARRLVIVPFRWLAREFHRMRTTGTLTRLPDGPRPARDWSLLIAQFNSLADEREAAARALAAARDEALEATRAKSEFLANMSHEIRTPMNAIIGFSDLLQQTQLTPEQKEYTGLVMSSAEALLHIINQILDLSKVEAGRVVLEELPFNLHRVVGESMMLFAPRARDRDVALRTSIAPDVPRSVVGDAGRVRQVLVNLIGNALKFTEKGEVRLSVEGVPGTPGMLRFRVQDSGIGIPADKLATIFEKFTQADASTTRRYGGTGLGLTICRELVKLMGGEVSVESTVGVGSAFSFSAMLPAASAEVPVPEVHAESSPPVRGRRVLVVDDNKVNRMVARAYLQRLGCEIETANNGLEGVERVQQGGLDLVFMDCQMPELDGFEATRRIRQLSGPASRIRIVAMTANAMQGDREACLEAGMDDYVSKPIREADLAAALRRVAPSAELTEAGEAGGERTPIFEPEALAGLAAGTAEGESLVLRLVDLFTGDLGRQAGEIQRAIASGDWVQVARRSQSLRSAAGTMGVSRLTRVLADLEASAGVPDIAAATVAGSRLKDEVAVALEALSQWRSARAVPAEASVSA